MSTRRQAFDDVVLAAAERLRPVLGTRLDQVDFAVEDVPPHDPAPWEERVAPLGRTYPRADGRRHRVVVYRRPIEVRADDPHEVAEIVLEVVVEQVARLLGIPPEEINPS